MKPQDLPEAKLAWLIWENLEELSSLLWDRYGDEFVSFIMEEEEWNYHQTLIHRITDIDHDPSAMGHPKKEVNSI